MHNFNDHLIEDMSAFGNHSISLKKENATSEIREKRSEARGMIDSNGSESSVKLVSVTIALSTT